MATGNKTLYKNYVYVDVQKNNVSLTVNKNNANSIDCSADVANNKPNGYVFDHLEFLGSWPASTWNDGLVTRVYAYDIDKKDLRLVTRASQNYTLRIRIWYGR